MAWKCLEAIMVEGEYVPLMQLSDLSVITDGQTGWARQVSSSIISSKGTNFITWFGNGWITDGTVYIKNIDNSNAIIKQYYKYESGDRNAIAFDTSNLTTTYAEVAYYPSTHQWGADHIHWAICIDDDSKEGVLFVNAALGDTVGNLYLFNDGQNRRKDIYNAFASKSGGAGSGYIGNSLLSNKKMVGYNVPTSSAESTKTESVNEASATPVSGKPKSGNGFARIKFLRDTNIPPEYSYISDINECYYSAQDGTVYDLYDKTIEYHRTTVSGVFHIINTDASFSADDFLGNRGEISSNKVATFSAWENITISVDSSNPSSVAVSYSPSNPAKEIIVDFETSAQVYYDLWVYENVQNVIGNGAGAISHFNASFNSLKSAIDYIYQHYCNITLIVDGALWVAHRSE